MDIDIAAARSMQRVGVDKSKHLLVGSRCQSRQMLNRLQHRNALPHVAQRQFAHHIRMRANQPAKQPFSQAVVAPLQVIDPR